MERNRDFFDQLEPAIRPCFRLFLSADLVGSTALKQKYSPFETDENDGGLPGDSWYFFVSDFYSRFHNILLVELERVLAIDSDFCARYQDEHPCSPRLSPDRIERWKLAGDEVLYSIEIYNFQELFCLLIAFCNALIFFRKVLYGDIKFLSEDAYSSRGYHIEMPARYRSSNLDVKGAAWTAGFPMTNKEVILSAGFAELERLLSSSSPTGRDLFLKQTWLDQKNPKQSKLVVDYVGPSVDTGFRLASLAQPRKTMVSAEIAYLLSNNTSDRFDALHRSAMIKKDDFRLGYDGRVPLKGVIGSRGYPVFWIDTGSDEGLSVIEDRLNGKKFNSWKDVRELCGTFFERNRRFIRPPVILDPDDTYNEKNDVCRDLKSCNAIWLAERQRIKARLDPYGQPK